MNSDEFLRCIEKSRDCDSALLDAALNRGIARAKHKSYDGRKMLALAAAAAFTLAVIFTANVLPFAGAADNYYRNRYNAIPENAETLANYVKELAANYRNYRGGE